MKFLSMLTLLTLVSCVPSTGGKLVSFNATASGPDDAVKGQPYVFSTPEGYQVTLTNAELFIGAVYLNQNNPANYQVEPACILPGIYSGELRTSLWVDALNPEPQPFLQKGHGTDSPTLAAELWLSSGDVQSESADDVIFKARGTARRGADEWAFSVAFSIGPNRRVPPRDPALPGTNPLCKQRIVSPIAAPLTLSEGGTLQLRLQPKRWFEAVDFAQLRESQKSEGVYQFKDSASEGGQPDLALYNGLRTNRGPYVFDFTP